MVSAMDKLMAKLPIENNIPTTGKAETRMSIEIGTYQVDHVVRPLRDASHKTRVTENGRLNIWRLKERIEDGSLLPRFVH